MNSKSDKKTDEGSPDKGALSQAKNGKGMPATAEKGKKSDEKTQADEMKRTVEEKDAKLEEQLQEIADLQEDVSQFKKKIDNLQVKNQILMAENKDLKEELQKNESASDKSDEKIKTVQRDAERQMLSLSKKNNELVEKIAELEHKLENATKIESVEPEELKASASNFWINLYQESGEFRGKIEHPFSRDKKSFVGIDQKSIIEFIMAHTPRIEETIPEIAPVPTQPAKPETKTKDVQPSINIKAPLVRPNEPIRLHFTLDLSEFESRMPTPLTWNLFVFAKPLHGGRTQQISEFHEEIETAGILDRQINASALPPGSYRLESILTASTQEGYPAPFSSSAKIGIVQVG